jgi:hypothetical protein
VTTSSVIEPALSLEASALKGSRSRQNWVLDPIQDALFIIVAPLIVLAIAVWVFARYGATEATALIIVAHVIMTVAHHLPTFIRIYGDVDLFKRFKWSFVLGPVIPLAFSIGVLAYINAHDYPVENFLYLYILLSLWDPWHFLRQHYGFMRIYDRANQAPRRLAANMDFWLCVTWFAYIMLASGAWLPGIIQDMYLNAHIVSVLGVSARAVDAMATAMEWIAAAMTVAYGIYLVWCWRAGYFISAAKLALFVVTFGVMYVTYTPNEWIKAMAPGWSFKVGFAAVGIVHMTQYLAIVWRYNRSLAANPQRSRAGVFRRWHGASKTLAWVFGAGYVALCLFYGDLITTKHESRWLMSALLAVGFTSTLLHYYFDGFIWKIRHKQNREALAMTEKSADAAVEGVTSWWAVPANVGAGRMFVRQLMYFGLPMLLLTVGAIASWDTPTSNYVEHMYRAQSLSQQGLQTQAEEAARAAFTDMNRQMPLAAKLAELEPTAAREAELAFLIYNQSLYEHIVLPQVSGQRILQTNLSSHRDNIRRAASLLESALTRNEPLAHLGREKLTREEVERVAQSWRRQVR